MNILIFIPDLSQENGGIRQYSIALISLLSEDVNNRYFIYHNIADKEILKALDLYNHIKLVEDKALSGRWLVKIVNRVKFIANIFFRLFGISKRLRYQSRIDTICRRFKIDIIHSPYPNIPHTQSAKLITTLHDVQEIHFPEYFSPVERAYRAKAYLDFLTRSSKIVVSYNHVKDDLIKYFDIQPQKIEVILMEMNRLWFKAFKEKDIIPSSEMGLPEKYLFYPANTWPHKNHLRLLEALAILRETHKEKITLVFTGHKNEYYYNNIEPFISERMLNDQVLFEGVVEERKLFSIYKSAVGVIIPTTYEAGSFPLIESIFLNIPVICSNVTSLPETIGDEKFLFDPFRAEDIAKKMLELWISEDLRKASVENARKVTHSLIKTGAGDKLRLLYEGLRN